MARAHGDSSPITRHALYVLETLDAIDPAYETFACALLDGDREPAGYPEFSAIVGGVAAHWDESTGDLIVRGVVGWGGTRHARRHGSERATGCWHACWAHPRERRGARRGRRRAARRAPAARTSPASTAATRTSTPRAVYCPKCGMRMLRA